jgi:CRISPR-associated protein Cas1
MLSFVYDVADLYKVELTIPVAFAAAADGTEGLEGRVRRTCRDAFHRGRLLQRIIPDLERIFAAAPIDPGDADFDADPARPGGLWDPTGEVAGGVNFADDSAPDDQTGAPSEEEEAWS